MTTYLEKCDNKQALTLPCQTENSTEYCTNHSAVRTAGVGKQSAAESATEISE